MISAGYWWGIHIGELMVLFAIYVEVLRNSNKGEE